jgi:hypothetical protein
MNRLIFGIVATLALATQSFAQQAQAPTPAPTQESEPTPFLVDGRTIYLNQSAFAVVWKGDTQWFTLGLGSGNSQEEAEQVAFERASRSLKLQLYIRACMPERISEAPEMFWIDKTANFGTIRNPPEFAPEQGKTESFQEDDKTWTAVAIAGERHQRARLDWITAQSCTV